MNSISPPRPRGQAPVAVIGGGLAGLAAACVLGARGHRVILLEKNDWLGGKAAVLEEDGFRFDMGPTILTVPAVLERIFAGGSTRNGAASSTTARSSTCMRMCRRCRRFSGTTLPAASAGIATSSE